MASFKVLIGYILLVGRGRVFTSLMASFKVVWPASTGTTLAPNVDDGGDGNGC